jgi:chorismate lyase/3-hydroxybenzoate synthase
MEAPRAPVEERVWNLAATSEPPVPAWVGDLVGAMSHTGVESGQEAIRVHIGEGARFCHVTAGFGGVPGMDILTFQQRVVATYQAVFEQLQTRSAPHPVRFWAFVPGIHDDLGAGLDRYMVFNAGRYGAYSAHFGLPTSFGRLVPTASTVGGGGEQLVLHCLAADEPGLPVENHRQIPAYRYSRRFGPIPPCFARATLLHGQAQEPLLLVGGTASITGEESCHLGHLEEQSLETFRNLASVVASASGSTLPEETRADGLGPWLAAFRELRIYHPHRADREAILGLVQASFPSLRRVELLQASLCRPELLIEIEGLALPPHRGLSS